MGAATAEGMVVAVLMPPEVNPLDREQVPEAGSYRPGDAVWICRHGQWNPGMVRAASAGAVLVDYHGANQRGVLTDTVPALYVMAREAPDRSGGGR